MSNFLKYGIIGILFILFIHFFGSTIVALFATSILVVGTMLHYGLVILGIILCIWLIGKTVSWIYSKMFNN